MFYGDLVLHRGTGKTCTGVFLEAMLANGVEGMQAKIMYYAVYRFGPRWVVEKGKSCPPNFLCNGSGPFIVFKREVVPIVDTAEFNRVRDEIKNENWDFERIEQEGD